MAGNVLHRDKRAAIGFIDVENRRDVGMLDGSGGPGFLDESLLAVFVLSKVLGEEFEGDLALQLGVLGEVDRAHATLPDLLEDFVV